MHLHLQAFAPDVLIAARCLLEFLLCVSVLLVDGSSTLDCLYGFFSNIPVGRLYCGQSLHDLISTMSVLDAIEWNVEVVGRFHSGPKAGEWGLVSVEKGLKSSMLRHHPHRSGKDDKSIILAF